MDEEKKVLVIGNETNIKKELKEKIEGSVENPLVLEKSPEVPPSPEEMKIQKKHYKKLIKQLMKKNKSGMTLEDAKNMKSQMKKDKRERYLAKKKKMADGNKKAIAIQKKSLGLI